jgi:DNA-binding MarR family transcriptional regulator
LFTLIVGCTNVGAANNRSIVGGANRSATVTVVPVPVDREWRAPQRVVRLPSWLLNQAALHANRMVAEGFAAAGLRRHHFTVLVALDEDRPASQAELGRRLSIDRSDIVAVVNDLEEAGLVVRERDERDRRRNIVRLTAPGAKALDQLEARVAYVQRPCSSRSRPRSGATSYVC